MGEVKTIKLIGEVKTDITFSDLESQAGDLNTFDTLVLEISSQGGCVEEGLKIMVWLDALSSKGKEVITVVSANAYSIASLIMLVADKRYISKHGEVMVHNPMVPFIEYANANALEKHVSELRELENMLQQLYVNFANISLEDIKVLLDQETYLSPDEAVQRGFADEVIDIKPKPYSMMAIKKELNMSRTKNMLNVVIAALNGSEVVNQLYYNTKGDEIQIFQSNPSKYGIGDKTSMEEGEVRLSDGTMVSVVDFEITDIKKEIEPSEEVVAEEAVPEGEVKVEEAEPVMAVETPKEGEVIVAEFNEGPAPIETVNEVVETPAVAIAVSDIAKVEAVEEVAPVIEAVEEVAPIVEAVEEVAPSVEVAPVIEVIEAVEEVAPVVEPIVEAVEEVEPIVEVEPVVEAEPVVEEAIAEDDAHGEIMDAMYKRMDEADLRIQALEEKLKQSGDFESLATEAIDTLARNTSSSFKPEARSIKEVGKTIPTSGSIFSRFGKK